MSVTYERPVEATLHVHLSNGETFEATSDDLIKFGIVNKRAEYARIRGFLSDVNAVLSEQSGVEATDLTKNFGLNTVRYIVESLMTDDAPLDVFDIDTDTGGGLTALFNLTAPDKTSTGTPDVDEFVAAQVADGAVSWNERFTRLAFDPDWNYTVRDAKTLDHGWSVIAHVTADMSGDAIDRVFAAEHALRLTDGATHPTFARWRGRDPETGQHRVEMFYIKTEPTSTSVDP